MSEELEAAGALVTASAVAAQIDAARGAAVHGGAKPDDGTCRNCGAALAGAYCHACGQSAHLHRSLLHLVEEVLHGVLHFDAKGWRTLPLLVARPGLLTRRYIDGQRMRYVSPLALFLFTVFLMFFAASFSSFVAKPMVDEAGARAELERSIADAGAAEAKAQAALAAAQGDASTAAEAQEALAEAKAERIAAQAALGAIGLGRAASSAAGAVSGAGSGPSRVKHDWNSELRNTAAPTGNAWLDAAIHRAVDNPELLAYKLKSSAYKFSFMLVPISLPFLWLLFALRRDIAVYDHAVFVLYSLSFMSLLAIAFVLLVSTSWGSPIAALLLLVVPVHMAMQLRETYGLGIAATLWRTAALLVFASLASLLFLVFIAYISAG